MNINFPPVDERYVKAKINDGFYSNATELVRDAVRRMFRTGFQNLVLNGNL